MAKQTASHLRSAETAAEDGEDLSQSRDAYERLNNELAFLFGRETVLQARELDIADLNLNEEIVACISGGIRTLKELQGNPAAQVSFINGMEPGARLLLCMWIMDMGLLNKIQKRSYLIKARI